ncbi:MAG: signal recognition particle protein [Fimbriimonadaceae bacterium]|nr:signal recognition particle protein [Fimbriimonadaceae bacterium]
MLDNLTRRISGAFSRMRGKGKLSEADVNEMLQEVRTALLEADVNFKVAKQFVARIKEKAIGEDVFGSLSADQTIIKIVRDELVALLGQEETKFHWSPAPPTVVLLCGLQGSGKTTTAAKLAKWLDRQGKKAMLAACDTQRPAAVKQLEVLGEQVGVPVYSLLDGTSPPQIARQALERAKYLMLDVLIVDTAGRLTVDDALMDELQQVHRGVQPSEILLVLDSTTGQEAVNVAQAFHERLNLTGTIFTKLDGDTRGGAVLSVRQVTGVPVRFTGVGEAVDALDQFYPSRMAERILGFGDVMGLIEQAESAIRQEDAAEMQKAMMGGAVDFNTLLQSFKFMRKMGPMQNIMRKLPGISQVPEEMLNEVNDEKVNRIEAIILSMTPKERSNPDIISGSRRKRIAAGSGVTVEDVNALLQQLYGMRKQMKQFSKLEKRFKKDKRFRRK